MKPDQSGPLLQHLMDMPFFFSLAGNFRSVIVFKYRHITLTHRKPSVGQMLEYNLTIECGRILKSSVVHFLPVCFTRECSRSGFIQHTDCWQRA